MKDENINIFIVDDNENDIYLIKRKLQEHFVKATFTMAHSFSEFKEKLSWAEHDLILSDYDLRGETGLDVLLHMKEVNPDIPFIFVTGMLNSDSKTAQAILTGASGFVLKDDLDELPATVNEVLRRAADEKVNRDSKLDRLNNCKLKLQQLHAYLSTSTFEKQMDCIGLVREVEQHLVELDE